MKDKREKRIGGSDPTAAKITDQDRRTAYLKFYDEAKKELIKRRNQSTRSARMSRAEKTQMNDKAKSMAEERTEELMEKRAKQFGTKVPELSGAAQLDEKRDDEIIKEEMTDMFVRDFYGDPVPEVLLDEEVYRSPKVDMSLVYKEAARRHGDDTAKRLQTIVEGVDAILSSVLFTGKVVPREQVTRCHELMFGSEDGEGREEQLVGVE